MAVQWGGVAALVVFYVAILLVGLWSARKMKNRNDTEEAMVAGRDFGMVVGAFTMTATWVGGGLLNGTAEVVYSAGLLYAQAPWGLAIGLVLGGLFFAEPLREKGYVTMLDPFQEKYGSRMGGLIFLPALMGELLYSAAILGTLGATVSVILELNLAVSVIVSACIVVVYSLSGGLYSIAYTDVLQLILMFVGMWLVLPFAMTHDAVSPITQDPKWLGQWNSKGTGIWVDNVLLLVFGAIPWQVYFQRVLSSRTPAVAQVLSVSAAIGMVVMFIPPTLIAAVASKTDWNLTDVPDSIRPERNPTLVLPLVMQYLTPTIVAFFGLGAVSAAVMSSADSSVLSTSSMFTRNIYQLLIRPEASQQELSWCMRITIILVGCVATAISITADSIYYLFVLCGDFVYVILFPQLLCVVHVPRSNTYGSLTGYIVGLFLRLAGGDRTLRIPALIQYPLFQDGEQFFPFRSFTMISSLVTILLVSYVSDSLFRSGVLGPKLDIFRCVVNIPPETGEDNPPDVKEMGEVKSGRDNPSVQIEAVI